MKCSDAPGGTMAAVLDVTVRGRRARVLGSVLIYISPEFNIKEPLCQRFHRRLAPLQPAPTEVLPLMLDNILV